MISQLIPSLQYKILDTTTYMPCLHGLDSVTSLCYTNYRAHIELVSQVLQNYLNCMLKASKLLALSHTRIVTDNNPNVDLSVTGTMQIQR